MFLINIKNAASSGTLWCSHKAYIRGHFLQVAAYNIRTKQASILQIQQHLVSLHALNKVSFSSAQAEEISHLQSQINAC